MYILTVNDKILYCTVKNIGGKNFGKLKQFAKFFAKFHCFHNIPYANGLQFAKVFSAKPPTVLIHQTFYCQSFLLYGTTGINNETQPAIHEILNKAAAL